MDTWSHRSAAGGGGSTTYVFFTYIHRSFCFFEDLAEWIRGVKGLPQAKDTHTHTHTHTHSHTHRTARLIISYVCVSMSVILSYANNNLLGKKKSWQNGYAKSWVCRRRRRARNWRMLPNMSA